MCFSEDMTVCVEAKIPNDPGPGVGTWCSPKIVKPKVPNTFRWQHRHTIGWERAELESIPQRRIFLLTIALQILDLKSTSSYIATASGPVV
jgi:hypothetical protein